MKMKTFFKKIKRKWFSRKKAAMKGVYHNLDIIYSQINADYFQHQIQASITWGKWGSIRGQTSIRLGSYDASKRLITIHPAMDQASVPRICVSRIIYHEMLHQKHPVWHKNGRRQMHTAIFREDEEKFLGAELADKWFKQNLERILRHRPIHLKNWTNVLTV